MKRKLERILKVKRKESVDEEGPREKGYKRL